MTCQQAKQLIHPYADGELDSPAVLELEQHLHGCSACAVALRNLQNLKKAVKQESLYFKAPEALRQRIKAELPSPSPENRIPQRPASAWNWNWLTTALGGAFAVCLALLLLLMRNRPSAEQQLAQEIVSGHVRSLMAGHVTDVASADQHTVKPWFSGKLDFSPPVRDLVAEGFPLTGGRLDYLAGHSAAALVFQRHKHTINLFVWPTDQRDSRPTILSPRQGYNLIHWSKGGMAFWAVSDLNEKELMEFVQVFTTDKTVNP